MSGNTTSDLRTSTPFAPPRQADTGPTYMDPRPSPYDQTQQAPRQATSPPSLPDLRTDTPFQPQYPVAADPFPSVPRQAESGPQLPTLAPPPSAPVTSDPFPAAPPPQYPVSSDPFPPAPPAQPAAPAGPTAPPNTWGGAFGGGGGLGYGGARLPIRRDPTYGAMPAGGYQSQPYGQPIMPGSFGGILGPGR